MVVTPSWPMEVYSRARVHAQQKVPARMTDRQTYRQSVYYMMIMPGSSSSSSSSEADVIISVGEPSVCDL